MQIDPPLKIAHRFPAAATITIASIVLSILMWLGVDLDILVATRATVVKAPWQLFTSTFLHLNVIHLLFNLSWWWPFACRIEYTWGAKRLVGITLLLAAISGAAQLALSGPGVGLSGVIYGLFAMLAVIQNGYPAFRGLISRNTMWMFAGWFVLCVVLSYTNGWRIGNVAHGAGAVAGYLLGRCIAADRTKRALWIAALAGLGVMTAAATFITPAALASLRSAEQATSLGATAYDKGDFAAAARYFEEAHRAKPDEPTTSINLGLAYQRLNRHNEALPLYKNAVALNPKYRADLAPAIAAILTGRAYDAAQEEEWATAHELVTEALEWEPDDEYGRKLLVSVRRALSSTPPSK